MAKKKPMKKPPMPLVSKNEANQKVLDCLAEAQKLNEVHQARIDKRDGDTKLIAIYYTKTETKFKANIMETGVDLSEIDRDELENILDSNKIYYPLLEREVWYEAVCRTYDEDGYFMNAQIYPVLIPQSVIDEGDYEIEEYILEEISDDMDGRCCEEDGEYSWALDDWYENDNTILL